MSVPASDSSVIAFCCVGLLYQEFLSRTGKDLMKTVKMGMTGGKEFNSAARQPRHGGLSPTRLPGRGPRRSGKCSRNTDRPVPPLPKNQSLKTFCGARFDET